MNALIGLLAAAAMATCTTAHAQDPVRGPSAADASYPLMPGKTPAEESATLAQRVKFGYESYGMGRRLNSSLHQLSDQLLRCLAGTGDAGAASALWGRWADVADTKQTHMPEAEEVALEQYRLIGHTILIYQTGVRYEEAATDDCQHREGAFDTIDSECVAGNANFNKAAAWFKLGEKLGDPVSARGFEHLRGLAQLDVDTAERDADALLLKTQPLPDVERYAYQCREANR